MLSAAPLTVFLALLLALALPACAADTPEVTVARNRSTGSAYFEISASVVARAAPAHVWAVLTDYERQPDYVPNLLRAKVIARDGNERVLEQDGRSSFLFFQHAMHLQVRVREQAPTRIDVELISGDMKHYSAHWQLSPVELEGATATRIDYSGSLEPDFFVPPLIGNALVRNDVRKMLAAVVLELEKPDQGK